VPDPPSPYFGPPEPPCLECGIVNPPPIPPIPIVPETVTFPGLPPVILLPGAPPPKCFVTTFEPTWLDPSREIELGVGSTVLIPEGLQDGTLEAWATQTWQKFSDFVIANGLTVTGAVIIVSYAGDGVGPPSERRWFADLFFQSGVYVTSYGLGYVLDIAYCTA